MYVCICNGVTDHQIREAASHGVSTVAELTMRTGCGATCGSCLDMAGDLLAKVSLVVPQRLSDKAREAVETLRAETQEADPRADLYSRAAL